MGNKDLVIVQRVLTPYRFELLKNLRFKFKSVTIVCSKGESAGGLTSFTDYHGEYDNLFIHYYTSLRWKYIGESRPTQIFFYPRAYLRILRGDIVILEGTPNILNNIFLIPLLRIFKKRIGWWDSGYSLPVRSFRRKVIDWLVFPFVSLTHFQLAYSTVGKRYMEAYMGAKNVTLLLNTIDTTFLKELPDSSTQEKGTYVPGTKLKLLFVGAIEKRKKIFELVDIIERSLKRKHDLHLTLVGSGVDLKDLKNYVNEKHLESSVAVLGPIYSKKDLKPIYDNSDLFILPGDGGLAIVQAILFGVPVLCVRADGTELDYLLNHKFICESIVSIEVRLSEIYEGLIPLEPPCHYDPRLSTATFIETMTNAICA